MAVAGAKKKTTKGAQTQGVTIVGPSVSTTEGAGATGRTIEQVMIEAVDRQMLAEWLERHPDNRRPDPAAVAAMAESVRQLGVLERLVVRRLGADRAQILSGETRWLAAQQVFGVDAVLPVRDIHCSDAQALELLATFNAKRTDLTTVEKAKLIARLHAPTAEGGGGFTWDEAGEIYSLSGSAAQNLTKLLDAPPAWQERLDKPLLFSDGEPKRVHQATVREVAKYATCPAALEAIDREYVKAKEDYEWPSSRDDQVHTIQQVVKHELRVMDKGYSYSIRKGNAWCANAETIFKATPEQLTELAVVEIEVDGKKRKVATNAKLFDDLQLKAWEAKAKGGSDGAKKTTTNKDLSPALAKQQAEQLERRIRRWRYQWIKSLVAARIALPQHEPALQRVLTWMLLAPFEYRQWNAIATGELLEQCLGLSPESRMVHRGAEWQWRRLCEVSGGDAAQAGVGFVQRLLEIADGDPDFPLWPAWLLEDLASGMGVDLADQWGVLQATRDRDETAAERFGAFFALHQIDQLDKLGDELGAYVRSASSKAAKVQILTTNLKTLKLPKSIEPLAAAETPAPKRGKRGAA